MTRTGRSSNITAEEAARVIAALAANLPPPEDVKTRRAGALCAYARDTGEMAFPAFPCRGNRIKCGKSGVVTYAANCRGGSGNCKYYMERKK